jgi:putative CocE/NonD family hydrolase
MMKSAAVGALILVSALIPARSQKPQPGAYSPASYEVKSTRGHLIRMRDGIRLSVDIFQPSAPGRFPCLLSITPYDNTLEGVINRARWFARRGYVVALADIRGRFDSEGEWDPFSEKHGKDGYDLVEWLAAQPPCDGNVGMIGGSYLGWTQWWTASETPPHLKAIAPEVSPPLDPFENAPYQNGILVSWMVDWSARMGGRTQQYVGPGPYAGFTTGRMKNMLHLPHVELNSFMGALGAPWFEKWVRNNTNNDYWQARNYQDKYDRIRAPSLAISGWFDANFPGTPANYLGMKSHGATPEARRPRVIIGPWPHLINTGPVLSGVDYGPDSQIEWNALVCRWFDYWLKGEKNGADQDPAVSVFVMGVNRWFAESEWPLPQTKWTRYYLDSGGKANSLKGDGVLSTALPRGEEFDMYLYDPGNPTLSPFEGGHVDGPVDTRIPAIGDEVLVYTTPPLREPVEVTGPVTAKLYAATSARDTDWMVRLIDVHPDGRAILLCDGVIRARYRDPGNHGKFTAKRLTSIEPNQVYEYTIDFWRATGNVFLPGHRIRAEISSSYFPYYVRNLNTGAGNNGLETRTLTATQKIYHSSKHPSHLLLPVIPKR